MATVTKSKFARRPSDPTPAEIEIRKAEVHAMRKAKLDAELANLELQEQEAEEADDFRDPRQTEQWIPVPSVDDDRRESSAIRHHREFYTRFFPSWSRLTTRHEQAARKQSMEWRDKEAWKRENIRGYGERNPAVPTWTIEPSFGDRTPRERIDDEIRCLGLFQGAADENSGFDLTMEPSFIALQRRVLARYLWGIRRAGRKIPRTPNWGYKIANQLMQERDESEPLDLFDVDAMDRVVSVVPQTRRDVIPFRAKRR